MTITLKLPSGHTEAITLDQWRSLRGAANRQLGGSGKAKGQTAERCVCGRYAAWYARRVKHACPPVTNRSVR